LVCENVSDCVGLGAGYLCQQGRCRTRSLVELASQTLSVEPPASVSGLWESTFPVVAWAGDRWRIAHVGRPKVDGGILGNVTEVVGLSELFPDGAIVVGDAPVEPERPASASSQPQIVSWPRTIGRDGTVAVFLSGSNGPFSTVSPTQSVRFLVPGGGTPMPDCAGQVGLAALEKSDDWLVLCHDPDGRVSLGCYQPRQARWSLPATELIRGVPADQGVELGVRGQDALLRRPHPTNDGVTLFAVVPGAAACTAKSLLTDLVWREADARFLRTKDGAGYFSDLGGQRSWYLPTWLDEITVSASPGNLSQMWEEPLALRQSPVGFAIETDGRISGPVRFVLSRAEEIEVLAVEDLPETGRIAFCYSETRDVEVGGSIESRSELLLSLFDRKGERVSGPTQLASTPALASEGCSLTWSGSDLLATWLEGDGATAYLSNVTLRARILRVR
jgi:hypothetical protein